MAELILDAEVRTKTGKGDAKQLRAAGRVPAVVYGKDITSTHISLHRISLEKILRKANRNALYEINVANSEKKSVIVRDYQKHPISHKYVHVDFQAISMDKPIKVDVDMKFVGEAIGKKTGGLFAVLSKTIKIECLPGKIPDRIELNVAKLEAGASYHVSDLQAGDYEILTRPSIALCQVSTVKEEEVAVEEVEAGTEAAAPAAAAPAAAKAAPGAKA